MAGLRRCLTGTLLALALATNVAAQAPAPGFLGLQPGQSSRAQVELVLGMPLSPLPDEPNTFEYRAPAAAADSAYVIASFFEDASVLSRLDVYLRTPLPASVLRGRFGTAVLTRPRQDGGSDELFYPALQALVTHDDAELADAVGFLSARWLADRFCDQFNVQIEKKAFAEATVAAEKALLIAPGYARAHLALGVSEDQAGRYPQAYERYLQAAGQPEGRDSRARALGYAGELGWTRLGKADAEVDGYFVKALDMAPDLADAQWRYGHFLLARKRYPEAKRWLHAAFRLQTDYLRAWRERADALYRDRDYAGAEPHLWVLDEWLQSRDGADMPPAERAETLFRHAWSLEQLRRKEAARDAYLRLLKVDAAHVAGHNNVAVLYWDLGDLARAEQHFRRALALDAGHFLAQRNLARLLLALQRPKEALAAADLALQIKADDANAMLERARALAALGKKRDALDGLERAVAAGFDDGKALRAYSEFQRLSKNRRFQKLQQQLDGGG